ncbi:MAG TPA: hypothetical protein PKD90_04195 [Phnomibacter sp.]|nr:hypothetical protein [Phnomibacter sp.]
MNNKSAMEAALKAAQTKLLNLQGALAQLRKTGFGICSVCQNPIDIRRLMAMPASLHCPQCSP